MATVTTSGGVTIDNANEGPDYLWNIIHIIRDSADWTIPRSGNGVSGGVGDYIASVADLGAGSWFVLRNPSGNPEILFIREATQINWTIKISPQSLFVGGDVSNPATATDETTVLSNAAIVSSTNNVRMHVSAETGVSLANSAFAVYAHAEGTAATARGAMAFVPISGSTADLCPWIFYIGIGTSGHLVATWSTTHAFTKTTASVVGVYPVDNSTIIETYPAAKIVTGLVSSSVPKIAIPNGLAVSPDGYVPSFPMIFSRSTRYTQGAFKGISDYAQWNGVTQAALTVLDTEDLSHRISFGDVNFPWDSSTPTPS